MPGVPDACQMRGAVGFLVLATWCRSPVELSSTDSDVSGRLENVPERACPSEPDTGLRGEGVRGHRDG